MKNKQPKLTMKSSGIEKTFNVLSFSIIIFLFLYIFYVQRKLPRDVPIHIGENGVVGFGTSSLLYLLPIIATILFCGIYFISKSPHLTSFPVDLNEKNIHYMYRLMKEMMACFNLAIVFGFGITIWNAAELVKNKEANMLGAIVFLFIVPILVLGCYSFAMWRKNQNIKKE